MPRICTHQTNDPHPSRIGWTVKRNYFVDRKADGSRDLRKRPRPGNLEIHHHTNGHRRLYVNGVLRAEIYAPKPTR